MSGRSTGPTQSRETGETRLKSFDDYELTLGDLIRGERATMGKSLLDVQRDIKIKAEYLAGIEETDLAVFETPGFIPGYVKSYARYLGMNPDWVYQRFCAESGFSHVAGLEAQVYTHKTSAGQRVKRARKIDPSDAMLSRSPISAAPTQGPFHGLQASAVGSVIVLAGLVGVLGYGGWSVLQEIQRVTLAPVETPLTTGVSQSDSFDVSGLGIENNAPTAAAMERLYRPQALDTPVLVPRDGPIATLDPAGQGVYAALSRSPDVALPTPPQGAPSSPVDVDEPEIQVVQAPPPEVVLFARRPAWVRVRAADGTILLEKILEEGERFVLPDMEVPPTLRAGNSGSVYFAVNGTTFGPAGSGTSVAKNVVLSASDLSQVYVTADLEADPELARMAEMVIMPNDPLAGPVETE